MSEDRTSELGFYGRFPESWNLTEEQKQAFYAMERAMGAVSIPEDEADDDA